MVFFPELIATGGVLLALGCGVLWRRARSRERLWREALEALAALDYNGAVALVARLEPSTQAGGLAQTLRRTFEEVEAEARDQQRGRRELEEVLSSLQDAVLVVDKDEHLRFLNAAALNLFDVRVEDSLGKRLLEVLPSMGLDSAVRAALREGRNTEREAQLHLPRPREVFLRVTPVRRSDGQVAGAVAILQDLTEMRRLERVRRDFVANASHELRTPIASMRTIAETILDSPEDSGLLPRFLPQLVNEAERLSSLVSDLLSLASAESAVEKPSAPVDLVPLLYNVINRLKHKAIQQHIEVGCRFGDNCADGVLVMGDADGLEQVIFNLLDNALLYTPAGGSVTLRLTRDTDGLSQGAVNLIVSDTGIGIPVNDLPRIFERFYRVDKARSRAGGGTGLGLAIVKHIVENHGGHVKAQSEPGRGAVFTVTLPIA
ncbi:MAG TPA: ATP-binding protein [Abditibacteriaceae bacterium]|nr:ATP-binding protein [Abditibacteriaceae bacterium]